ncbi:MAG: HAMP domain-containing histidine kinase [Clostridia bacterium]|nr:HAMP domain-containing histidine kinase [Clostridia bacterium]
MSLQRRLIISNAAIVVIPILITLAASFAFIYISMRFFDTPISYNGYKKHAETRYELFRDGEDVLRKNPEILFEKEFAQYLKARFSSIDAEIVIFKKSEILSSTLKMSKIDLEKCLETEKTNFDDNTVEIDRRTYIVKVYTASLQDKVRAGAVILAPVGKEGTTSEAFIFFVVAVFIVSFIAANVVLSFILSKSIAKPLERLQGAAGEISNGNLDYEVIEEGEGEIRDLCLSFENMRLKLKESVHTQMKYDDNRKMLVSSISHDLKTPITSIKGYIEGIMEGVANTPEKTEKYLKTIYSKAIQVDAMIDDLLLYSKLDLNQIPFHFEKTEILSYFKDCVTEMEPELEKVNIKIGIRNELKESSYVMVDRDRVRRVVINIIDNARKYMNKETGEINIILREAVSKVIIEIQDNGRGITKAALPHIFDRFYREDAARSKVSGSGLGLAIAKQIIEGHEGRIWAKSRENEGTSIMISLKKL